MIRKIRLFFARLLRAIGAVITWTVLAACAAIALMFGLPAIAVFRVLVPSMTQCAMSTSS